MPEDTKMWRSQVRLPQPMIDWVKQQAQQNFRSVNAELAEIIRLAQQRATQH